MRTHRELLKRIAKLGLLLMMGVSMSGCSSTMSWKEEVKLSDGRVIVIERELLYEGGGDELASNRRGEKPREYRIRFAYPVGSRQMIEWKTTKIDSQTWPEVPLIFDMESGQPTVFTLVAISSAYEVYSKYVFRNGAWIEEPLPDQFEPRATNLFFGNGNDMPTFLNLEEKFKRNSDDRYRPALRQVGPNHQVRYY